MSRKIHLLIIDPQNDFARVGGALFVNGADGDMKRLAEFIRKNDSKLDDIHVTLDNHQYNDISHPARWMDQNGKNPDPFTIITADDVRKGVWMASMPFLQTKQLEYTENLERNKRYPLCIWPPHCLIGTEGAAVVSDLSDALYMWERKRFKQVRYVVKGTNPHTEHYSAVVADVVDPTDPSTQLNTRLIDVIQNADEVLIAGEALSHCVANTVRDIADNFSDQSAVSKFVLLTDASSNVTGFESFGNDFVIEMKKRGMKTATTADYLF